jgi:hypothetical protein
LVILDSRIVAGLEVVSTVEAEVGAEGEAAEESLFCSFAEL